MKLRVIGSLENMNQQGKKKKKAPQQFKILQQWEDVTISHQIFHKLLP